MGNFWIVPLLHSVSNMVSADGEICMPKEMQVQASQRSALPPPPPNNFQLSIQMTVSYKRHININETLVTQYVFRDRTVTHNITI